MTIHIREGFYEVEVRETYFERWRVGHSANYKFVSRVLLEVKEAKIGAQTPVGSLVTLIDTAIPEDMDAKTFASGGYAGRRYQLEVQEKRSPRGSVHKTFHKTFSWQRLPS